MRRARAVLSLERQVELSAFVVATARGLSLSPSPQFVRWMLVFVHSLRFLNLVPAMPHPTLQPKPGTPEVRASRA